MRGGVGGEGGTVRLERLHFSVVVSKFDEAIFGVLCRKINSKNTHVSCSLLIKMTIDRNSR